jgi:phosphoribosylaminoimidazole-succinocarboxamide synthase
MQKGKMLYEGKAKKIYETSEPDMVIQEFKDDASAFNALKTGTIVGKGVVNNAVSCKLFKYLSEHGIENHFVEQLSERDMACKVLDIIKVEVVVRNIAAGSLVKRYGFEEGHELGFPIVEYYLKNDELGDPLMNESHAILLNLAKTEEFTVLKEQALKINALLLDYFYKRHLKLVDFKLEFGRHHGKILLGDEISPDTCRLWDASTGKKMDKDRFRFDLGDIEQTYQEVQKRVLAD